MGLLSAIAKAQKGEVGIASVDQVVGTDADAITPDNQGKYGIYRSVPVLKEVRSFTQAEADALDAVAKASEIEAVATKQAMRSMKKIKTSDTVKHKAFNSYRAHEAALTTEQVESNAQTAKTIEGMRGRYGLAHQSLQGTIAAENAKQQAIFGQAQQEKQAEAFKAFW